MPEPIVDLEPLLELISGWPGLMGRVDRELVADSLVLLPLLGNAPALVDVGSGGGLPGLPLKLARPDLQVTLLEANRRKAAFLVDAAARLGLRGVEVVAARAEDAGHDPGLREAYPVATARALAPLAVVAELCLPLVHLGGRLLAMKAGARGETEAAGPAIRRLGGELVEVVPTPSAARSRGEVVVIAKLSPTPPDLPRRAGVPARQPLGM